MRSTNERNLAFAVSCRHQAREAEPKNYDIKDYQPQKRNLHNSTYHRIGNVTDGVSSKETVISYLGKAPHPLPHFPLGLLLSAYNTGRGGDDRVKRAQSVCCLIFSILNGL